MTELQMVWGWQPALYLFLGGMGAGAFIVAAVLYFYDREGSSRTIAVASWASAACIVVGLLLLLSELTNPLRGTMMWQSFSNLGSWMTFGAWVAFASVVVTLLMAVLSTERFASALLNVNEGLFSRLIAGRGALAIIGALLCLCVAAYTGILLMSAPGVPLWNTMLLPCLFTVSALDTGVALVELIAVGSPKTAASLAPRTSALLERLVVALVAVEAVVLAAFLMAQGAGGGTAAQVAADSTAILTQGALALPFWVLMVACGLALPFGMALYGLAGHKGAGEAAVDVRKGILLGAGGALVGGCALRFLVLAAGLHADYVAASVATLL